MTSGSEEYKKIEAHYIALGKTLPPCTLTLTGPEAMELLAFVMRGVAGSEMTLAVMVCAIRDMSDHLPVPESVDFVFELMKATGREMPRYLKPLTVHVLGALIPAVKRDFKKGEE